MLALCCLLAAHTAVALPPDKAIRQLRQKSWLESDGAPAYTSGFPSIAQSDEGFLLLATSTGLTRFDGRQFEAIDIPVPSSLGSRSLSALFVDTKGGVWVGFRFGGAAHRQAGKWEFFGTTGSGSPMPAPYAFAEAPNGDLWMTSNGKLWRLRGHQWQLVDVIHGGKHLFQGLMFDSAGGLWLSDWEALWLLPPDASEAQKVRTLAPGWSADLAESAAGEIWMGDVHSLQRIDHVSNPLRKATSNRQGLAFDRDGTLWDCDTANGLLRLPGNQLTASDRIEKSSVPDRSTSVNGLLWRSCDHPFEDSEGDIWLYTSHGLHRLSDSEVDHPMGSAPDATLQVSLSVPAMISDGNSIWTTIYQPAHSTRALTHVIGDQLTQFPMDPVTYPQAFQRSNGTLVVADDRGLLESKPAPNSESTRIPYPTSNNVNPQVQGISEDADGNLWLSVVREGVFERVGDSWQAYGGLTELPRDTPLFMTPDAQRHLWLAYLNNLIVRVDRGRVDRFSPTSSIGNVLSIYTRRTKIWAGGALGLAVLVDNRFRSIISKNPRDLNSITGLIETANGDLWLLSASGIVSVAAGEWRHALQDPHYRVTTSVRNEVDGVVGLEERIRPLPTVAETQDGRLWFATSSEIYSVDPSKSIARGKPPAVHLKGMIVDGMPVDLTQPIHLAPGVKEVRFDFVGVSLATPGKVRYRYRLRGLDADWRDGGNQQQVVYANPEPGRYQFEVTAALGDAVWNETGDRVDFDLRPTFYQTGWFKLGAVVVGVSLLTLFYQSRTHYLAARLRERHAERSGERERIARELHDTLLQGTEGLILKVQSVVDRMPESDPARMPLMRSLDQASTLALEGRESIQGLRDRETVRPELGDALQSSINQLTETDTTVGLDIVGLPREIKTEVWDDLYRIAHEALWNAIKHSGAQKIQIRVRYERRSFLLQIEDNGAGIEASELGESPSKGHYGLITMRERARQVTATFDIWTKAGVGTRITIKIAGRRAYRPKRRPMRVQASDSLKS